MKLDLFAVADHASVDAHGKLSIIGIFDTIGAKSIPVVHRLMFLVLRFQTEYADSEAEHQIEITLEGSDGENLLEAKGVARIGTIEPGQFSYQNQIIEVERLKFERSGTYLIRVKIDGDQVVEKPLRVVRSG